MVHGTNRRSCEHPMHFGVDFAGAKRDMLDLATMNDAMFEFSVRLSCPSALIAQ
jgi:hypothetical protein